MSYRDDRDALRERIEQLERKAAMAVSPAELAAIRDELAAAKDRIDAEREALDALLGRLGGEPRRRRRALVLALLAVVVLLGAGVGVFVALTESAGPSYEGAPNAARRQPARREMDVEVARLMPDLDGCLPDGDSARIQVEMVLEGATGAPREITTFNVSEHDSYPMSTPACLESVLSGVSTAPFRAPSYRYQVTLDWSDGRLQPPRLWERYGLTRDPREP